MKRREFMKASAGVLAVSALGKPPAAAAAKGADIDVKSFFSSSDPAVMKLTEQVFAKCILGKLFGPAAPMKHNWIGPGGGYKGQWIWDTMFVVDLLSILPGQKKVIRDVFQNYWDFQVRWNKEMPDYAHDMIPCMIVPGNRKWVKFPAYSQIPILAWGVERVYRRNGDTELIKQCLRPLERFHDWYWRERDVTNSGLIAVGSYNPIVQHARWETFDYECNMDALKLTKHPTRKGQNEGKWYGDICVTGNTSFLVLGEKCLVRLAEIVGDKTVANAIENGISERYDSISGKRLGVEYLGMTCTVVTMMLDGLCRKHKLQLRKA